jgi:hypothetical protein
MNHYGISAIHWDMILGEIDQVLLHKVVRHDHDDMFALTHGERVWRGCCTSHSWRRTGLGNAVSRSERLQEHGPCQHQQTTRPERVPLQSHEKRDADHRFD